MLVKPVQLTSMVTKMFLQDYLAVPQIMIQWWGSFSWVSTWTSRISMYVEHRHYIIETLLHPEKCTVCCVVSTSGIVGPMLFMILLFLINISMSSNENSFHFSKEMVQILEKNFFNRNGLSHTLQMYCWMCLMSILMIVSNHFPKRLRYGWAWPPYSPDLNLRVYFLWGHPER